MCEWVGVCAVRVGGWVYVRARVPAGDGAAPCAAPCALHHVRVPRAYIVCARACRDNHTCSPLSHGCPSVGGMLIACVCVGVCVCLCSVRAGTHTTSRARTHTHTPNTVIPSYRPARPVVALLNLNRGSPAMCTLRRRGLISASANTDSNVNAEQGGGPEKKGSGEQVV